ncbi:MULTISPECIES: 2OG-Fe(II) oxygenase [Moorena]|uniref:Putative proline hydroxylase n=3 Tax=Moorena TaxID=1155738 RepID=F4XX15_9CYAN|nr:MULTISPECIES: 2OG-Fe(II) oxygenase [Moorena]EGJ30900.1 putative proline hydroxylase [Moorena producens 3L]
MDDKMYSKLNYCLEPEKLTKFANDNCEIYAQSEPFPHIIMDNFFPEDVLDKILNEFPKADAIDWQKFDAAPEKKLASKSEIQMGEYTRFFLYQLNSSTFLNFLETLTGIDGIIPDPHFVGGGLHQIEKGGYLKIHADFNRHTKLRLDRRLNLLIYLNKDWQEDYGGYFEMWDKEMTKSQKKILPVFNRCVIFNTTDFSYHGHPEPLTCPEGRTRKSLALYYYSNGRPAEELSNSGDHSTLFKARPGEKIQLKKSPVTKVKKFIKKLIIE